jgi:hypothetical protein
MNKIERLLDAAIEVTNQTASKEYCDRNHIIVHRTLIAEMRHALRDLDAIPKGLFDGVALTFGTVKP